MYIFFLEAPCPVLTNPYQGNVTVTTYGAVTTATYTCDANFTMSGDTVRTCQSTGSWSGVEPSCGKRLLALLETRTTPKLTL